MKNNNADLILRCSFCGNNLSENEVAVIEEKDQKTTFHATCFKCRTATIIFFTTSQAGIISLGMATDLGREEIKEKYLQKSISTDEVLDAHQLISGEKSNFLDSLSRC